MLRVQLATAFFGPNSHYYNRSDSRFDLREIPDEFENVLPKGSVIVSRDDEKSPHPLKTESVLDKKFNEAQHQKELVDQGLANAIAVDKAQTGKKAKAVDEVSMPDNHGARSEVAATARQQNEGSQSGRTQEAVTDPELEAALARRATQDHKKHK